MTTVLRPRDLGYPALLGAIPSPPELHVRGALTSDDALAIAIVGSRQATPYGLEVAERLAGDLAARGVTIVSGLARGIDSAAHRGAMQAGGRTIAVLGCGVDIAYPPENRRLLQEIERQGAILSQFPPGTPPLPGHFPARNRTLAGLVLGVVIVEAAERSGALITAGFAGDLGREVFAIPGKITSKLSEGSNSLLRDGAILVRGWMDVVQELPDTWRRAVRSPRSETTETDRPETGSEEGRLLAMLRVDEPRHIDDLIGSAGLSPARVAAALASLELAGWGRQLEGQRWIADGRAASRQGPRRPPQHRAARSKSGRA